MIKKEDHHTDEEKPSMYDLLHYCLVCDEIAEEVSENKFCCTKCRFVWEIIDCG